MEHSKINAGELTNDDGRRRTWTDGRGRTDRGRTMTGRTTGRTDGQRTTATTERQRRDGHDGTDGRTDDIYIYIYIVSKFQTRHWDQDSNAKTHRP